MLEKNYTNPEDKGRFGFSASGKYRAPYKAEHIPIAIVTGVAITLAVIAAWSVFGTARSIIKSMIKTPGGERGLMFVGMVGSASLIIVFGVIAFSAIMIIKYIRQGFKCSYMADEEKFTAIVGGTRRVVYYKEVQTVHFLPIVTLRRKVRGYIVTVVVSGANEEFGIVSDGFISEKSTPFYIITERVELIRAAEEREHLKVIEKRASGIIGINSGADPETDGTNAAITRLESLLGKDAEMPGISAENVPLPEISERVSPTVNGYIDDMPAVDAKGRIIQKAESYVDNDGIERSFSDVVAQGSFSVTVKRKTAAIVGAVALAVYVGMFLGLAYDPMPTLQTSLLMIGMIVFLPLYAVLVTLLFRMGRVYHYRANGREFVITSKGIPDERFLYKDVQSVTYRKFSFLWVLKGYKVEILTRFGIKKYNYVLPGRANLQREKNLPFEAIRERIENKK